MTKIESTVSVIEGSKLAIEMVGSGLSASVVAPAASALATIFVVIVSTWYNSRNNRKMMEHQRTIHEGMLLHQKEVAKESLRAEHEEKVSEFRHEWLKELREVSSCLYKIIEEIKLHKDRYDLINNNENQAENGISSTEEKKKSLDKVLVLYSDYLLCFSKLSLLFKPNDESVKEFLATLDVQRDTDKIDQIDSDKFIEDMKCILKKEWEVTKSRSWADNYSSIH